MSDTLRDILIIDAFRTSCSNCGANIVPTATQCDNCSVVFVGAASSDSSDSGLGHSLALYERFGITNFVGLATPWICPVHGGWHLLKPFDDSDPSLSFPGEEQRIKQLRAKRDEYVNRITLCDKDDMDLRVAVQSRHHILDQLLRNGTVRFRTAYKEVCELTGQNWPYDYTSSWRVIEDYVETGGKFVAGGSLPSVSE